MNLKSFRRLLPLILFLIVTSIVAIPILRAQEIEHETTTEREDDLSSQPVNRPTVETVTPAVNTAVPTENTNTPLTTSTTRYEETVVPNITDDNRNGIVDAFEKLFITP